MDGKMTKSLPSSLSLCTTSVVCNITYNLWYLVKFPCSKTLSFFMLMNLLISSITYIHLSIQVSKWDQFVGHDKFGIAFEYMLSIQLHFLVFGRHLTSMKTGGTFMPPILEWKRHEPLHIYYSGVGQVLCLLASVKCKVSPAPK